MVGLDEHAATTLADVNRTAPLVILIGNEGRGLAAAARSLCDDMAAIAMQSRTATSLNLAVAGSIALYQLTRP